MELKATKISSKCSATGYLNNYFFRFAPAQFHDFFLIKALNAYRGPGLIEDFDETTRLNAVCPHALTKPSAAAEPANTIGRVGRSIDSCQRSCHNLAIKGSELIISHGKALPPVYRDFYRRPKRRQPYDMQSGPRQNAHLGQPLSNLFVGAERVNNTLDSRLLTEFTIGLFHKP
jgi:hypothetical protein